MTPNERLDQIEPLLADALQKIDRLIEGQSQIINEVSKIPRLENNISKTAEALAKLTVSTQRQYEELKVGQQKLGAGQEKLEASQQKLGAGQEKLEAGQEKLEVGQEKLEAGQESIMQYLREKLP